MVLPRSQSQFRSREETSGPGPAVRQLVASTSCRRPQFRRLDATTSDSVSGDRSRSQSELDSAVSPLPAGYSARFPASAVRRTAVDDDDDVLAPREDDVSDDDVIDDDVTQSSTNETTQCRMMIDARCRRRQRSQNQQTIKRLTVEILK